MQTVRFRSSGQSRGTETAFTPPSFRAGLPRARGVPCELGDPPAWLCAARAASLPPSGETPRGACLRRALPGPAARPGWGCFPASAPAFARAGDSWEVARWPGLKRWDARPHTAAGMSAPRPRCLLLGRAPAGPSGCHGPSRGAEPPLPIRVACSATAVLGP